MLRIITLNLNGMRSALGKGLLEWLAAQKADVVCMQEVKAQLPDLAPATLDPRPYSGHFSCAGKQGYSGAGPHRQASKFRFLREFFRHLRKLKDKGDEIILCGDWNIAHQEIDLKNWRSNRKNSGFLPEERAWLTRVFDELGFVDVFRRLNPKPEQYTWWSNRGQAWAHNVGWRIDYHIATPGVAARARKEAIYKAKRFSDHAPLTIDYDWPL